MHHKINFLKCIDNLFLIVIYYWDEEKTKLLSGVWGQNWYVQIQTVSHENKVQVRLHLRSQWL